MFRWFSHTQGSSAGRPVPAPVACEPLEMRRMLAASPARGVEPDEPTGTTALAAAATVAPSAVAVNRVDPTTAGTWRGVYGGQAAVIAGDARSLPSYASFSTRDALTTWSTSTTERRAPEKVA